MQQNKHNNIQFINETDSIIADSNGRIFSGLNSPPGNAALMSFDGAAVHSAGSMATVGVAGVKRPITSQQEYIMQSDDSYDSYEDEIDQLVFTSRDSRRRPEGGSSVSSVSNDGPRPGKKTKGRVKIKMEFIENKLRRYTTFSKRKTGIMKKAYELSTLTGTQVMLLVASETGHVYTFATRKLQPMITSDSGKALIQTCLNSPDIPNSSSSQTSISPELPSRDRDQESPLSVSRRGTGIQRTTSSRHPAPSSIHDSLSSSLSPESAFKVERVSNNTTPVSPVQCKKQCTLNDTRQQSECSNIRRPRSRSRSRSDDDESRVMLTTSLCNDVIKRHELIPNVPVVAPSTSCKQTKDYTTTTSTTQQSVNLLPDKQWLSPPLLYKLPGSNQIISLPALKTSNGSGTLIYQTPQGLLLASPTSLVGALRSDGSLLTSTSVRGGAAHLPDNMHNHIDVHSPVLLNVCRPVETDHLQRAKMTSSLVDVHSTPTDLRFIKQLNNLTR